MSPPSVFLSTCIKATHFWASFRLVAGRLDSNNPAAREAKRRLELRAEAGEAWFDRGSLTLTRIN